MRLRRAATIPDRDHIRSTAIAAQLARDALDGGIEIVHRKRSKEATLSAEDDLKELVGFGPSRWVTVERQDAAHSHSGRGRRS